MPGENKCTFFTYLFGSMQIKPLYLYQQQQTTIKLTTMTTTKIQMMRVSKYDNALVTYNFINEVHGHRGQEYTCHYLNVYGFSQMSKYKNLKAFEAAQKRLIAKGGIITDFS